MTIKTSPPSLNSAIFVLNFAEPQLKIRFSQALAEEAFGRLVNAQSQQTNLPDQADPAQPRIIFHTDKKRILISQLSAQLQMNFVESSLDILSQLNIIRKNAIEFFERAIVFMSPDKFSHQGLVVDIAFETSENLVAVRNFIHDQFIKIPPLAEVASTQIALGYKTNGLFINLAVSDFELRDINIGATGVFRLEDFPVKSQGLLAKVDVNNLPSAADGLSIEGLEKICSQLQTFINNDLSNILGLEMS